jgi:hypothetical protein
MEKFIALVKFIIDALVEFKINGGKFTSFQYEHLELKNQQKIQIEHFLQMFADDVPHMKDFLTYVIDTYGDALDKYLTELKEPSLNLYHKLLECLL